MKISDYLKESAIDRQAREPVYEQIAAILLSAIEAGALRPGDKLPATRELCDAFGVNHLTVRQAVKHLAGEGHVVAQPGRGAFVPSADDVVRKILLMVPFLGHEQSGAMSRGVRGVMERAGYDTYVLDYNENPETERAYLEKVRAEGYLGAIFYPSLDTESTRLILQLMTDGFPLVLLDREFSGVPGWYVVPDNHHGGFLAGRHLVERGCKNIACVVNNLPNVQERLRGFKAALAEAGQPLKESRILQIAEAGDPTAAATAVLLETDSAVDGIFYYNDYQALFGCKKIRTAGKRIPEDIKVVGFDDVFAAQLADPPLTTIHQHPEESGAQAAEMLLRQLDLPPKERFRKEETITEVKLVCRESTGSEV